MLTEYINAALRKAQYKVLDDGSWFAEIPGFDGVWASGAAVEESREELREVLEEWLICHLSPGDWVEMKNHGLKNAHLVGFENY